MCEKGRLQEGVDWAGLGTRPHQGLRAELCTHGDEWRMAMVMVMVVVVGMGLLANW